MLWFCYAAYGDIRAARGSNDHPHDLASAPSAAQKHQMGPAAFSRTAPVHRRGGY